MDEKEEMSKIKPFIKKIIGSLLLIILLTAPFLTQIHTYLSIPREIITFKSDLPLNTHNTSIEAITANNSIFTFDSAVYPTTEGKNEVIVRAANLPVKKIDVSILEDKKIIPGGQSVGVKLHTLGVLVVGHHLVNGKNGTVSPGEDAKVEVGDIILELDGEKLTNMTDVKPIVEKAGELNDSLDLKIKRGKSIIETHLQPIFSDKEKEYQIGLYIRDSATGIGTVSFYDPESKKYGALGHVISDVDTKKPIEIYDGKIVRSTVTDIEKGNYGSPGEKQAKFSMKGKTLGSITKNSPFGIFGILDDQNLLTNDHVPMSIAQSHEVKEGPAEILTVINGEKIEKFAIEIVTSIPQKFPATKGMVIKVTDKRLLKETGGIVQGMSGSPIIQDGKLIGAVTHVFVNDPTSGYGVHIEWMLDEAGINIYEDQLVAS